jgi:hypothetical protein
MIQEFITETRRKAESRQLTIICKVCDSAIERGDYMKLGGLCMSAVILKGGRPLGTVLLGDFFDHSRTAPPTNNYWPLVPMSTANG